jgi:hypothetical protein
MRTWRTSYVSEYKIVILSGRWMISIVVFSRIKGTPVGQHSVRGFRAWLPPNSISPCFFTISAVCGFKIGLV